MRPKILIFVTTCLIAFLGIAIPGCYTILAVDDSPSREVILPPEPAPAMVFAPPGPPPVPAYVSAEPATSAGSPHEQAVQRTSGVQREGSATQHFSSSPEQRPVRTSRGH